MSDGNGSESRIKRSVWYVGKLRANTTEDKRRNYIQQRADELQADVTVFEAKVFHRDNDDTHCSGRIMVDCASSPVVGNKSFWPRPIYTRPWKIPAENKQQFESSAATGTNIPEHTVLAQPVGKIWR